ncbi:hypothetical protein C8J57DRAFT_1251904 [Mycena rebaudengoi]|nr:hypothetical protein C8J57DRAFT_1251904 [Mycena rebaudengoi]
MVSRRGSGSGWLRGESRHRSGREGAHGDHGGVVRFAVALALRLARHLGGLRTGASVTRRLIHARKGRAGTGIECMVFRRAGVRTDRRRRGSQGQPSHGGFDCADLGPQLGIFGTQHINGHGLLDVDLLLLRGVVLGITVKDVPIPSLWPGENWHFYFLNNPTKLIEILWTANELIIQIPALRFIHREPAQSSRRPAQIGWNKSMAFGHACQYFICGSRPEEYMDKIHILKKSQGKFDLVSTEFCRHIRLPGYFRAPALFLYLVIGAVTVAILGRF